jgi:NAD(P)-dependent dehydrogenase (short-subunit alcohol dehydrogenase family)
MQVKDKVFVVTGGGNGIAREVVLQLLAKGARVAAVDVSEKGLAETAQLAHAGTRLTTHVVDITDRAAVEALPAAVLAKHGQIDGVTHIAGIIHRFAPLTELAIEEIERVVRVNYWGTVYVAKTFLPYLMDRPEASLVSFSSMGALVPVPGQGAYGSSKAAVKLFAETLFAELRGTNVAVTVVFPGGVATNITGNSGVAAPAGAENVDTSKMPITTPQEAARLTVQAIEKGTPRLRIGKDAISLDRLSRLNPTKASGSIAKKMQSILGDSVSAKPQQAPAATSGAKAA